MREAFQDLHQVVGLAGFVAGDAGETKAVEASWEIPEKEVESTPLTQPIIIASAAAMASPSEPVIYNEYGEVVKPHEYVQDVYKPPDDMGVQVIVDAEDVIVGRYYFPFTITSIVLTISI